MASELSFSASEVAGTPTSCCEGAIRGGSKETGECIATCFQIPRRREETMEQTAPGSINKLLQFQ